MDFVIGDLKCTLVRLGEKYDFRIDNQSFEHLYNLEKSSSNYKEFTVTTKEDGNFEDKLKNKMNGKGGMFNFNIKTEGVSIKQSVKSEVNLLGNIESQPNGNKYKKDETNVVDIDDIFGNSLAKQNDSVDGKAAAKKIPDSFDFNFESKTKTSKDDKFDFEFDAKIGRNVNYVETTVKNESKVEIDDVFNFQEKSKVTELDDLFGTQKISSVEEKSKVAELDDLFGPQKSSSVEAKSKVTELDDLFGAQKSSNKDMFDF